MLFCIALQASSQPYSLIPQNNPETAGGGVKPPMICGDPISRPKTIPLFCCRAEDSQHLALTCGWPFFYTFEYNFIIRTYAIFHMHFKKTVRPVTVAAADRLMMGHGLDIVDEKMPGGPRLGPGRLFLWQLTLKKGRWTDIWKARVHGREPDQNRSFHPV
jgi:hypothetical protein